MRVVAFLPWLWSHTLASVWFGISLMAALALYIAIGSGMAGVREYFEVNEQAFFNAWPLFILAVLLCATLLVVTFERIPFTPPRYGVWTIHFGIVLLIFGMVYYFRHKTEGLALVPMGQRVSSYHDSYERALFIQIGRRPSVQIPLPDLPRFKTYAAQRDNDHELAESLRGLRPTVLDYDEQKRAGISAPLHRVLGLEGDEPIEIDILAYYPYAVVGANYEAADSQAGGQTGIKLVLRDPETGESRIQWLVAGDEGQQSVMIGSLHMRHVHRDDEVSGESLLHAAQTAHAIQWSARGQAGEITIEPGQRQALGNTGYEIEAAEFLPSFPMSGTGEPVDTLELLVHPPADSAHGKTFRRYVLDGQAVQTDFVLDAEGAGPKGKRQTEPVDPDLVLRYSHADGLHLAPHAGETERHTFLTRGGTPGLWQLLTSNTKPAELSYREDGVLPIRIDGLSRQHSGEQVPVSLELDVERADGVIRHEWVQEVPPQRRDRRAGEAGTFQVVTVRLRRADEWEQIVQVPFTQWSDQAPWRFGEVRVPGADVPVRLQLGNTRRRIPTIVQLDRFELVPYAGDFTTQSTMRDFKSHLTLIDSATGRETPATAHLNSPVYFKSPVSSGVLGKIWPHDSWLLYQAQWDPEGQQFTVLGVGNRPGSTTMTFACVMIVSGLLYAFYAKPIIIRRMKEKALAELSSRKPEIAKPQRRKEGRREIEVLT